MLIKDFSKNCTITDSSFLQDLEPYHVENGMLKWQSDNSPLGETFRSDIFTSTESSNIWLPHFVTNDNEIDNKAISHYGSLLNDTDIISGRLGYEDFVKFTPKFKNWSTNGTMVIDWILNRTRTQYSVYGGILYWSKKPSIIVGTLDKFPIYTKLLYNNVVYLKIDDSILKRLGSDVQNHAEFNARGDLSFNYDNNEYISINNLVTSNTPPVFALYDSDKQQIWIPEGDQLLYYLNNGERNLNTTQPIGLRSYVPGSLYKHYNNIYNAITCNYPLRSVKSTSKSDRLIKKLAHSLSTSPFVGEFFVSILSNPKPSLKTAIEDYINNTENLIIDRDINKLRIVLNNISNEFSQYEINDNNIVRNKNELFIKLINKYGAKLKLSGDDARISYIKPLKYGDSVLIEEIGDTFVNKNLKDTIVTNNKKISLSKLSLETDISEIDSAIELKVRGQTENTVHLYNHVKPELDPDKISSIAISLVDLDKGGPALGRDPIDDRNSYIFYWNRRIENTMDDWLKYCPRLIAVDLYPKEKFLDLQFPSQNYDLLINEFSCVWDKISGPPLKFVDLNKTQTQKLYNRAYGNEIVVVPSTTGKYTVRCTVSSPFGSYTQIKVFYVVKGVESLLGQPPVEGYGTYASEDNPDPSLFRLQFSTTNRSSDFGSTASRSNVPILLGQDKLKVFIADLGAIAIDKRGLFVPIRTNYYVEKVLSNNKSIEKLRDTYNFMFDERNDIDPINENSFFSITYNLNNTLIKLDRIILKNLRNEISVECSQCYSPYKPKLRSYITGSKKPSFLRSNKDPDTFSIQRYIYDQPTLKYNRFRIIDYKYPKISTDFSPKIATYGGYGYKILDKIGLSGIPNHSKPLRLAVNNTELAKNPSIIPSVTGYYLDNKDDLVTFDDAVRDYKFCYQKTVMPTGYMEFKKGTFVPSSGWIIGDNRNLSSVLKFNPGARKSYNFTGPGILGLSNYSSTTGIKPNIFSSAIELNINPFIRWDRGPGAGGDCLPQGEESRRNALASAMGTHYIKNHINKELADQYLGGNNDYHHGYRILNGGTPKGTENNYISDSTPQNDEFNVSIDEKENKFLYSFNVVGPNNPIGPVPSAIQYYTNDSIEPGSDGKARIVRDFIEQSGSTWGLRNARINNLQIKDVEVKLNFLNYVNTKNLVIWLDVEFSSSEGKKNALKCPEGGGQCSAPSQILGDNIFVDQFIPSNTHKAFDGVRNNFTTSRDIDIKNSGINNYLKNITDQNSLDNPGGKLRLYLLNQETIQNKEYNFNLTFSDSASKHNALFDYNSYARSGIVASGTQNLMGCIDPYQQIVTNNSHVRPTRFVETFSTKENCYFSSLAKQHNLNINNNTFRKFANRQLFLGFDDNPKCPPMFPPYDSFTKFTLNIAVLTEEDEMFPIDTLINNELYANITSVDTVATSANLFNNLCSWELILHTEEVQKPTSSSLGSLTNYGTSDLLSAIEYGESPKYPGYGFIADLSDKQFLLPMVNMNAPYTFFQNYNFCEYADSELIGKGTLINSPRFPTEAILFILAGTAVGGMTGTLVGVLVGGLGATYNLGFQLLFDYFKESRAVPLLEFAQRETFDIDYDGYPFGGSDKILINASKDGCFWYKMEASIFKLDNTPALSLKRYNFFKSKDSDLFRFDFITINKRSDIIDNIFVPYIKQQFIKINDTPEEDQSVLDNIDDIQYRTFNFLNNDILIRYNKFFGEKNIFDELANNKILVSIQHDLAYHLYDTSDTIKFTGSDSTVSATITAKALIYKDESYSTILSLELLDGATSLASVDKILLPPNVIAIYDPEYSSYQDGSDAPISEYGMVNDTPPDNSVSIDGYSTFSPGSYGDGSNIITKNILSRKFRLNYIKSISETFNNFMNDRQYANIISLSYMDNNSSVVRQIRNRFKAYPVYYLDGRVQSTNAMYHYYDKQYDARPIETDKTIEELENLITGVDLNKDYGKTYIKDNKYNLMYLKISSNSLLENSNIISSSDNFSGTLTLENNYEYRHTIRKLKLDELNLLTLRLDHLNKTKDESLEPLIGRQNSTNTILNSSIIYYIERHYESLDQEDYENQQKCRNKLQKLYTERREILDLLDNQTIARSVTLYLDQQKQQARSGIIQFENTSIIKIDIGEDIVTYDKNSIYEIVYGAYILNPNLNYGLANREIIPESDFTVVTNVDGSLNINYTNTAKNYYWINIDPKQSCSLAEELRPRVLKSAKYSCESTNPLSSAVGGTPILDYNNICPKINKFLGKTGPSVDFTFDAQSSPWATKYTTKEDEINQKKQALETKHRGCIYGWKEQTIERKFRINSDKNIDNILNNIELLVTVTETYDVAITQIEHGMKQAAEAGLTTKEAIDLLVEEGIMKSDGSGDILNMGLLNGFSDTDKHPRPTRVYNIFNLDDISTLKVQFRKVPRMIRGIDFIGTVLRYGENNTYRPQNRPPLNPLDMWNTKSESLINNFYYWECFQQNPVTQNIIPAQTPEFFKLMNEMWFRAFFGSVDHIEHKTEKLKSLYDWEAIPFEYFTKPPPPEPNP